MKQKITIVPNKMQSISIQNALLSSHCIPHKKMYYKMQMQMTKNNNKIHFSSTNSVSLSCNATGSNDVIIVGAGVAGSALAHTLAKEGRRVHVIERSLKEPNKIVGEILQAGGYLNLLELGLQDCVRGIDAQILIGCLLVVDGQSIKFPISEKYSPRSFHYGRFVQKLRLQAASLPKYGTVTSLIEERGIVRGVRYKNADGDETTAHASLTVVCDGGFSSLHKFLSKPKIEKTSHVISLILENSEIPDRNFACAISSNPSIGLYPLSSTELRCGIGFTGLQLPSISNGKMADYLKTVVFPQIPPELSNAFIASVEKGEIKTMPFSCKPAAPHLIPGALLLGDSLNMRNPILATGMTVALHDVALIHNIFTRDVNLQDIPTMMQYTQHFYNLHKSEASAMNVAADCMHKVFYTVPDEIKKEMYSALFNYYSRKGTIEREELLICLNSKPTWRFMLNVSVASAYMFGSLIFGLRSFKQARALVGWALDSTVFVSQRLWDERKGKVSFTEIASQQNKLN